MARQDIGLAVTGTIGGGPQTYNASVTVNDGNSPARNDQLHLDDRRTVAKPDELGRIDRGMPV